VLSDWYRGDGVLVWEKGKTAEMRVKEYLDL